MKWSISLLMRKVPDNATAKERLAMFLEYCDAVVAESPGMFLPFGVDKRWWHFFKLEHPRWKYREK